MQQNIFDRIDDSRLRGYVVWLPCYPGDSEAVARRSSAFLSDRRVTQFWDARGRLGTAFGKVVSLPGGKTYAWDVYFAYRGDSRWDGTPPRPDDWMHQLGRDSRRLDAQALSVRVRKLLSVR